MPNLTPQLCTLESVGSVAQMFLFLTQTFIVASCAFSSIVWPADYGEIALKNGLEKYHFIIVGAGSAGAIVATRLSENREWKVLLLEAGGDPQFESDVPGLFLTMLRSPVDWEFYAKASNACMLNSEAGCYVPRGKMMGGSSSINFMIYLRGTEDDFNEWAEIANGWDYESVLPYFKKSEGNQDETLVAYGNGRYHNGNGPVKVSSGAVTELNAAVIDALVKNGFDYVHDLNANKSAGFTLLQSTNANGRRSSTAKSFLEPTKHRNNLHIIKHAFVDKILLNSKNEAYGVEFTYKGKRKMTALNKKEIILSAGTIQSPPLLMRSGIGPKDHLTKRKIPCKVDLPVGKNFVDHVFTTLNYALNLSSSALPATFDTDSLNQYIRYNNGSLISMSFLSGRFDPTNGTGTPEIQVFYVTLPRGASSQLAGLYNFLQLDKLTEENSKVLKENDILIIVVSLNKPKSRGTVELPESAIGNDAIIDTNFLNDPSDRLLAVQAIKQQVKLLNSEPFQKLGAKYLPISIPECDAIEFSSDAYWICYIKYVSSTGHHQVGTSKMGTDPSSVVDPRCKVHNVKGLRQIDAGVIPVPINANTNAASMMVGEKGADIIKDDYGVNGFVFEGTTWPNPLSNDPSTEYSRI